MSTESNIKTLMVIDRKIWARVKHFAVMRSLKTNEALNVLLDEAMKKYRLEMA